MTKLKIMPHSVGAYLKGVGVESVELDANNHLIVYLDNGETVDAGEFKVDDELDTESTRPLANKTLSSLFSAVNERINTLVGGNATEAIDNLNEIIAFLQNFKDSETLASTLAEINNAIAEVENDLQIKWRDKGYEYEAMRFTETGEYDVPSGVNNTPTPYIVNSGNLHKLEGKISLSGGTYIEKINNKLVISGVKPIAPIYYITKAKPILDILIPNTVLRKDDVLGDIIADSTLPVQSDAIAKELQKKVEKVEGKGLSTNDYTNEEKAQVAKIEGKQNALTLTVKDNGNIVLGNIAGQTKEFMPATPSGDPMHDKYLKVYGLTYDDNTGLWSYRASEGGLTDLTTDEVANMYIVGGSPSVQDNVWCRWAWHVVNRYPARMNMFPIFYGYKQGLTSSGNYSFAFGNNSKINVAVVTAIPSGVCQPTECGGMFRYASNLERIIGTIDLSHVTNTGPSNLHMFDYCRLLQDVSIINLKTNIYFGESPLLSKQSLLGLIQNAKPTSAITITLHADAYARLANDADILAALTAQPNITLISA